MNKEESAANGRSVLGPFLLGGIVGAAVGLLLAPKSGKELRDQIREIALDTKDKVSSSLDKGLDIYDDAKVAITSAVEAGKQAYSQEREKFQETVRQ